MNSGHKFLLILLLSSTLLSCSAPKSLEYRELKNLTVEKLGFSTSTFRMDIVYNNPNNFGLQLRRADLDIYVDNNFLGHTSLDTLITIPRGHEFTLPIKFEVDMKNIMKNLWSTAWGKEVILKVTGSLKLGKANIFVSMPVNYEGKQKVGVF